MTTLDDKILGEKLQYYYSSSEDEESDHEEEEGATKSIRDQEVLETEIQYSPDGTAVNTGPKGVINDWRKYKQLENEQRQEQKREMERLIKKLSLTCRSHLEDEEEREREKKLQDKINGKLTVKEADEDDEDDDEEFLAQYRQQRIAEMRRALAGGRRFAQVYDICDGEEFLSAVDQEDRNTLVLVHLYEPEVPACQAMEGSLLCLALQYPLVKFCRAQGSAVGASALFRRSALPALLLYRGGELVGNLVRVSDQLGDDFYATDVEALLQEYGLLPDKDAQAAAHAASSGGIRSAALTHSDSDSDLDID
ncbi:phosducin-like protein [Denticeps clupeoides]|uniref:Phosducin domain-containing protein n=1 Tax=Denticeps clupeoides TaxID=299321 RepID=A0AAY4A605_9TELE|nr:phosducin-like protein [Denticeps clupeoides]XP_028830290.1 phosducin-like protein [Denticeps clupeoides]